MFQEDKRGASIHLIPVQVTSVAAIDVQAQPELLAREGYFKIVCFISQGVKLFLARIAARIYVLFMQKCRLRFLTSLHLFNILLHIIMKVV